MRLQISCSASHGRASDILDEAAGIVRELVEADRSRGLDAAFDRVARASGLTARRIRSYWHNAVSAGAVTAFEIEGLRAAQAEHMRAEMARCEHRLAVLRARLGGASADHSSVAGEGMVHGSAAFA
ncbi:hypothetical protein UFOVP78_29 [uncultured Caudovirales phage]|uniref:Uncharacterized protein n=1 Tax=uncultured Caudovirales phage TaxID=2100421 RepID=A0A6J5L110_9CAUD|nr:hypothetical protein UFOVP78_29 [uncultured Caudovirales phage]